MRPEPHPIKLDDRHMPPAAREIVAAARAGQTQPMQIGVGALAWLFVEVAEAYATAGSRAVTPSWEKRLADDRRRRVVLPRRTVKEVVRDGDGQIWRVVETELPGQ